MAWPQPAQTYLSQLQGLGLQEWTWDEVAHGIELQIGPAGLAEFRRHHRNFTQYPTESTVQRFYDFAYGNGLHPFLAGFRLARLAQLAAICDAEVPRQSRILEVGAGGGYLLRWLAENKSPESLLAADLSDKAEALWSDIPCAPYEAGMKADILVFADSLGEIHSDEDNRLAESHPSMDMALEVESRYGFSQKLNRWKPALSPGGRVLLMEPIPRMSIWKAMADGLAADGWSVSLVSMDPACHFLRLQSGS